MSYYKKLRDLREDNDYKQDYIAKYLNITQQQYQLYESGKREIKLHQIIELAKLYNISLDYLTGITEEPTPLDKTTRTIEKLSEKQKKLLKEYDRNPTLKAIVDILMRD